MDDFLELPVLKINVLRVIRMDIKVCEYQNNVREHVNGQHVQTSSRFLKLTNSESK